MSYLNYLMFLVSFQCMPPFRVILQLRQVYPCFLNGSVKVLPTHFICFHCPHSLHCTCPDFVLFPHMSHTSFLFVFLKPLTIFLLFEGILSCTAIRKGNSVGRLFILLHFASFINLHPYNIQCSILKTLHFFIY